MFAELFTPEQLAILGQIILIDLVLAGDNAIIIGMVASKFPLEQRKKIIFWGIGGAVILRIILTLLTAYLLQITGLRLIGGLLLLYIVYKLYIDVIKGFAKIAGMMQEDKIVATESENAQSVNNIEDEISSIVNDRNSPYWNKGHPDHDKMVQQVYTLREMLNAK